MPAKDFLQPRQKEQLQKAFRESNSPHLREGAIILLLLNARKSSREITDLLGCSYRTVAYWSIQGDPNNLEALLNQQPSGNFSAAEHKGTAILESTEIRKSRVEKEYIPSFNVKVLEDTFARIKPYSIEFASSFYNNLFTDYPQLRPLFTYTRMEEQHKKLMMALVLVINNLRNIAYLSTILKDLGERHVRYGTQVDYYPCLGAVLLKTLEYYLGTDWTPEVKQAWAEGYEGVVHLMLKGHQEI